MAAWARHAVVVHREVSVLLVTIDDDQRHEIENVDHVLEVNSFRVHRLFLTGNACVLQIAIVAVAANISAVRILSHVEANEFSPRLLSFQVGRVHVLLNVVLNDVLHATVRIAHAVDHVIVVVAVARVILELRMSRIAITGMRHTTPSE